MAVMSTETVENYLKQIYHLALDASPVKTSSLAAAMSLSPAAVTEMLKRLSELNLVTYTPYYGVELTELGSQRALIILRRHRLWEVFLEQVLKLPWNRVHEHAERLEHATDDELANYIDDFLGRPRVGPHGKPVPGPDGTVIEAGRMRLTELNVGDYGTVVQFSDERREVLDRLHVTGVKPGARVYIKQFAEQMVSVKVDGTLQNLAHDIATTVIVRADETS